MTARRRCPRTALRPGEHQMPPSSGPRWMSAAVARSTGAPAVETAPAMPHMALTGDRGLGLSPQPANELLEAVVDRYFRRIAELGAGAAAVGRGHPHVAGLLGLEVAHRLLAERA